MLAHGPLPRRVHLDGLNRPGLPGILFRSTLPRSRGTALETTRALLTFGSPLDKTAFIFRTQARKDQEWIREQLAASVQPIIVSYELYRPPGFAWINIWSKMDIIGSELNYYDDPALPPNVPPCVQNIVYAEASIPIYAPVQYWNDALLRRQLYRLVS